MSELGEAVAEVAWLVAAPTELEIWREARALLAQGWCQCDYAQRADGRAVWVDDPTAVRWCLVGAILRARQSRWVPLVSLTVPSGRRRRWQDAQSWNDASGRTQAQVLAAVDARIAELEQQE